MAKINLLPWRDSLKKEQQRQFASIAIGSVIFMVLIVVYLHIHFAGLISAQEGRNAFLQKEIEKVDKDIVTIQSLENDKQNLLARMNIIQQLQGSRPEIVHLFDETAKTLPDGVYLTKVNRAGLSVKIEGVAESNANVSTFMKNLDASEWIKGPRLDVIDSSKKEYAGLSWFNLRVAQTKPEKSDDMKKADKK
ncbi:MAG: PilN domain-containing protein [Gammaproteobacteria bacterium]|nr:PilN domain-containing protein [Gammaproteobacteria bacterium]